MQAEAAVAQPQTLERIAIKSELGRKRLATQRSLRYELTGKRTGCNQPTSAIPGLDDPRRELLWHFFRLVLEARPRFFLTENVRGLSFPKNRAVLDAALSLVEGAYDILGPIELDAVSFGAATSRPRVFVIGVDRGHVDPLRAEDLVVLRGASATVRDAIADLRSATRLSDASDGFDRWRRGGSAGISRYARRLRSGQRLFTSHRRVPHTPEVARRFASVPPGKKDTVGRHVRPDWNGQCPTIRAGTGPQRGSFQAVRPLHPDEPRVITVREAARLQGFPDHFLFHPTVWHNFRMIGNSVSPIAAAAIFGAVRARMAPPSAAVAAE